VFLIEGKQVVEIIIKAKSVQEIIRISRVNSKLEDAYGIENDETRT
jgi:hypothetical protein